MSTKSYIKNAAKYIVSGHRPQNISIATMHKTPDEAYADKVVLVTGGGKGIGRAIAEKIAQEGGTVLIVGRKKEELEKAVNDSSIKDYYVCDITKIDAAKKLIERVYEKYGKIDVLVNNAGVSLHEKDFCDVTEESFDLQVDTNLKGSYFFTQAIIKQYIAHKQKEMSVIFISSERGSFCDDTPYGLTKIAINSLTKGLSRRYYKDGIRVNAVAPGVTATDLTGIKENDNMSAPDKASGRYFLADEVAEVVAFVASDYAKCLSGEVINCDAGNHISSYF